MLELSANQLHKLNIRNKMHLPDKIWLRSYANLTIIFQNSSSETLKKERRKEKKRKKKSRGICSFLNQNSKYWTHGHEYISKSEWSTLLSLISNNKYQLSKLTNEFMMCLERRKSKLIYPLPNRKSMWLTYDEMKDERLCKQTTTTKLE